MGAKIYELHAHRYHVSPVGLERTEQELRALHGDRDTIGVTVEERLLMLRALAAIADGHGDARGLAEAAIGIIDRAARR